MTFEEISKVYKDQYGEPEEKLEYSHEKSNFIECIWWMQGIIVTFACSENKDDDWKVVSTNCFEPEIEVEEELKEE